MIFKTPWKLRFQVGSGLLPWPSLYEDIWHCEFLQIMWKLIFPTLSQIESLQLNSNPGARSLHRLRTRGEYQRLSLGLSSHKVTISRAPFSLTIITQSYLSYPTLPANIIKVKSQNRLEEGCHSTTVELSGLGSVVGEVIFVFYNNNRNNKQQRKTTQNVGLNPLISFLWNKW